MYGHSLNKPWKGRAGFVMYGLALDPIVDFVSIAFGTARRAAPSLKPDGAHASLYHREIFKLRAFAYPE